MKLNVKKLKPSVKFLREEFVYSGANYSEEFGSYLYENEIIAVEKTFEITQDPVYKTSFYNDELYNAIVPKNAATSIKLYDESGNEIKGMVFSLEREYGAIVFSQEPSTIPAKCKAVIYCGPTADKILATDGKNTMDADYTPSRDQHVVTKKYLENELNSLQAGLYTLSSLNITQKGKELPELIKYSDGEKLKVVFLNNKMGALSITTNSFIIEQTFSTSETYISLVIDGKTFCKEKVKDVMEGKAFYWEPVSSKNIFETDLESMFWLNSFRLVVSDFREFRYLLDSVAPDPSVSLAVKISCGNREYAASTVLGIDDYTDFKYTLSLDWQDADLLALKTNYISGYPYLASKTNDYNLNVNFHFNNAPLYYYRPDTLYEMGIVDENGERVPQYSGGLKGSHIPYMSPSYAFTYDVEKTIRIHADIKAIYFTAFSPTGNIVGDIEKEIECPFSDKEELYRVTTPNASFDNPESSEFAWWDSKKSLEPFELSLRTQGYILPDETQKDLSAIAFKFDPEGNHYSHLDLDIEHNGKMYIRSVNNTSWLDCDERVEPFDIPMEFGAGCKLGEGQSYTFGKVVYNTPILIRILGATSVKMNSISIR